MANILSMAVRNGGQDLLNDGSCVLFAEGGPLRDFFEEFASRAELCDQVVTFFVMEDFV